MKKPYAYNVDAWLRICEKSKKEAIRRMAIFYALKNYLELLYSEN